MSDSSGPKPGEQNVKLTGDTFVRKDAKYKSTNDGAKGKIMIGSKDEPSIFVEAQYNPQQLEIGKGVPWSKVNEANRANQGSNQNQGIHLEFTGAEGRSLSVEMLFDTVEEPTSSKVKTAIENLEKLASVRRPGSQEEQYKRPHRCLVVWGETVNMSCVIENLSVKYEMFSPEGKPLRARATVKLKEADVVSAKMPPRPRSQQRQPNSPPSSAPSSPPSSTPSGSGNRTGGGGGGG